MRQVVAPVDRQLTHSAVAAAVVRALPDAAVAIVDHELRLTWAAGKPLDRVRWDSDEIVGRRLADVLPPPVYELVARCCLSALAGRRGEAELVSPRRGRRHSLVVEPLVGPDGETLAALAVLRDPEAAQAGAGAVNAFERRNFEYQLQELAEHDPLTGLPNRSHFERELDRRVTTWRETGAPTALLLLDLDHFKYVNDAHGHRVGDELLRRVAVRVRATLPTGTVVARLGGDELAALVPGTEGAPAERVAQRLVAAIRTERLAVGSELLGTTASVGVAEVGASGADAEGLLVAADLAMYRAKASGGDRAVLHDPAHRGRERVSADLRLSQRIRAALEEDRLELHAQPIVDALTGMPEKYELLVRLRDEAGALIGPGEFLAHAERFGLVGEIDRWVVGQAAGLGARLDVTLAVNLSGRSVGDPTLLGFVEAAIAEARLDPRRLVFEVTETAAIASMGDAQRLATGLRALGCGFTLDDFGAGFASFTYGKQLPFDYLKIDGSFVRDLPTSAADRLVVSALVDVARGLGKRTVAEFVCSPEVLAEVRSCGVDLVQGHYVGAAAPLEAWVGAAAG